MSDDTLYSIIFFILTALHPALGVAFFIVMRILKK